MRAIASANEESAMEKVREQRSVADKLEKLEKQLQKLFKATDPSEILRPFGAPGPAGKPSRAPAASAGKGAAGKGEVLGAPPHHRHFTNFPEGLNTVREHA